MIWKLALTKIYDVVQNRISLQEQLFFTLDKWIFTCKSYSMKKSGKKSTKTCFLPSLCFNKKFSYTVYGDRKRSPTDISVATDPAEATTLMEILSPPDTETEFTRSLSVCVAPVSVTPSVYHYHSILRYGDRLGVTRCCLRLLHRRYLPHCMVLLFVEAGFEALLRQGWRTYRRRGPTEAELLMSWYF